MVPGCCDTFYQEHIFTLKNSRPARIRQVKNINYRAFHQVQHTLLSILESPRTLKIFYVRLKSLAKLDQIDHTADEAIDITSHR